MDLPEEVNSNVEPESRKRPLTDVVANPDENINADSNQAVEVVGKDQLGSLKHLKRAKIDRRSRGRTSSIHGSGNSPEIPSNFDGKIKTLKTKVGDKVSEGDLILTLENKSPIQEKVHKKPIIEKEFKKVQAIKSEINEIRTNQNKVTNISSATTV